MKNEAKFCHTISFDSNSYYVLWTVCGYAHNRTSLLMHHPWKPWMKCELWIWHRSKGRLSNVLPSTYLWIESITHLNTFDTTQNRKQQLDERVSISYFQNRLNSWCMLFHNSLRLWKWRKLKFVFDCKFTVILFVYVREWKS